MIFQPYIPQHHVLACPMQQALQAQTSLPAAFRHEATATPTPNIDFCDPQSAFASKTSRSLLKSLCTLQACRIKPLVNNATSLLKMSRACLGQKLTDSVVEATFFNHFCAGEAFEHLSAMTGYLIKIHYQARRSVQPWKINC